MSNRHVEVTGAFNRWLRGLRDPVARLAVLRRIERLKMGNAGDAKAVGGGISELRIDVGPGYRVYFFERANVTYVLLCGGSKASQGKDIQLARQMVAELKRESNE